MPLSLPENYIPKPGLTGIGHPQMAELSPSGVIFGGRDRGNDASHDRQGGFFTRNRVLSVMQAFSGKLKGILRLFPLNSLL